MFERVREAEKTYDSIISYLRKKFDKKYVLMCVEILNLLRKYNIGYKGTLHLSLFGISGIYSNNYLSLFVDEEYKLHAMCIPIGKGRRDFFYIDRYDYKVAESFIKKYYKMLEKVKDT